MAYLQVPLVYSLPSTSKKLNFINLHLSSQFILVNKVVNKETARRSLAAFQCHCRCCKEVTAVGSKGEFIVSVLVNRGGDIKRICALHV